jgi:hypothetical protein
LADFNFLENKFWLDSQNSLKTISTHPDQGNNIQNEEKSLEKIENFEEISEKFPTKNSFLRVFNNEAALIPVESVAVSGRLWRVAFIAASGGGAMLAATAISPTVIPTVMTSIGGYLLPLASYSPTASCWSQALSYLLNSYLHSIFPTVSHSIMANNIFSAAFSSYGATVAGCKMVKRTAPLRDFALEPLHAPSLILDHDKEYNENHTIKIMSNDAHHSEGDFDLKLENGSKKSDYLFDEDILISSPQVNAGFPIYIAVCGHYEKGCDPRSIWGANGTAVKYEAFPLLEEHSTLIENTTFSAVTENTIFSGFEKNKSEISEWEQLKEVEFNGWWRTYIPYGDEYILLWEELVLDKLHDSFRSILTDKITGRIRSFIINQCLQYTPINMIKAAARLPLYVLSKIKELDDPWVVAMNRAEQAGKLLAKILLATRTRSSDIINNRPISLVGYGMGARLIFHCLVHLAGNESGKLGIVENVVLIGYFYFYLKILFDIISLGAPINSSSFRFQSWLEARSVVCNRFVNCYSNNDIILAILYRRKSYDLSVAGLGPIYLTSEKQNIRLGNDISDNHEIENIDVSHLVYSHSDYPNLLSEIMNIVKL